MFKKFPVKWQLSVGFTTIAGFFVSTLLTVGFLISGLTPGVGEVTDRSLPRILAVDEMDLSRSEVQQFLTDVSARHNIEAYFNTFYSLGKTIVETNMRAGMDTGNALMKGSDQVPGSDKASEALSVQLTSFRNELITKAQKTSLNAFSSANFIQQIMLNGGFIALVLGVAFSAVIVRGLRLQSGEDALSEETR